MSAVITGIALPSQPGDMIRIPIAGATLVTIDVGTLPTPEATVDVADVTAALGQFLIPVVVGVGPDRDGDELECDTPSISGWVPEDGVVRLHIVGREGFIHDAYRVTYTLIVPYP